MTKLMEFFKAFNHSRYNLHYVFDKLPIATVITDNKGIIVYYNQAQSHLDGIEPSDALGKKETDIYTFHNFPDVHKICQTRGRPVLGFVWPYRTIYGKTVEAAYWLYPLFRNNIVIGSICFSQPTVSLKATKGSDLAIEWPNETPLNVVTSGLLGKNLDFQRAVDTALETASSPSPVLIAGETGSGKELFARFIHEKSHRAQAPFMAINCSAIPENLLEGILFGTVKGSFTGAVDRPGLLEEANGGTFFLDEMDSMPVSLQAKLLRVLQEMRSRRIGSAVEVELDLKIISSVSNSLANIFNSGSLRQDLFYRLAVIVIEIPPLRQRIDDLEILLNHFINKYNKQLGKRCCNFNEPVMRCFSKYNWPGNVRELENLVAGTINLAQNDEMLTFRHLPLHYQRNFSIASSYEKDAHTIPSPLPLGIDEVAPAELAGDLAAQFTAQWPDAKPAKQSDSEIPWLSANEFDKYRHPKDILAEALAKSGGNVAKAARTLGLSRQLLAYHMKKNNLKREDYSR